MSSCKAFRFYGVTLGAMLLGSVLAANAASDDAAREARQRHDNFGEQHERAPAREPLRGESMEELRRQSFQRNAAMYREKLHQSAAAKDAAIRKEAARLIMERAAGD